MGHRPSVVSKNYTGAADRKAPPHKKEGSVEGRGTPQALSSRFSDFLFCRENRHFGLFVLKARPRARHEVFPRVLGDL